MTQVRRDALAVTLLGLVIAIAFLDVLAGHNGFYFGDLAHYYHPAKKLLRDLVLRDGFPSWNPYFHAGQPLAANPEHEVFYPLTWLILLPDFELGFHLLIVVHVLIAALATYALLRSMRVGPFASACGALSFALGGIVLSSINLLPILFSVAWMPLTLLYALRYLAHRGRRDLALASFFLGLQLLVGEPTTVLQTGLLLGIGALAARPFARRIASVALLCAVATGLGAVQLLPAIDHFGDTIRARGLPFDVVSQWSLPPARLLELVSPGAFGQNAARLYPGLGRGFFVAIDCSLLLLASAAGGLLARVRG